MKKVLVSLLLLCAIRDVQAMIPGKHHRFSPAKSLLVTALLMTQASNSQSTNYLLDCQAIPETIQTDCNVGPSYCFPSSYESTCSGSRTTSLIHLGEFERALAPNSVLVQEKVYDTEGRLVGYCRTAWTRDPQDPVRYVRSSLCDRSEYPEIGEMTHVYRKQNGELVKRKRKHGRGKR